MTGYWWACFQCLSRDGGYTLVETVSEQHPFTLHEWAAQYGRPVLSSWRKITRDEYLLHPDCDEGRG